MGVVANVASIIKDKTKINSFTNSDLAEQEILEMRIPKTIKT
jgi:hypothetical protein